MKVKIHAFISCDLHSTVSRRRWNFFIHFSGTFWITALSFLKPVLAFVPFAKFGQKQSPLPPMRFVLPLGKLVFRPFQKHLSVIFPGSWDGKQTISIAAALLINWYNWESLGASKNSRAGVIYKEQPILGMCQVWLWEHSISFCCCSTVPDQCFVSDIIHIEHPSQQNIQAQKVQYRHISSVSILGLCSWKSWARARTMWLPYFW